MCSLLLCHQEKKFPPHDLCLPIQYRNSWSVSYPTCHSFDNAALFKQEIPVFYSISQTSISFVF